MPGPFTDQQFIDALKQTGGLITRAAKLVPCGAEAIRERIKAKPDIFQPLIKELREELIDDAEAGLAKTARSEGPQALQAQTFIVRTIGKDRGYVERTEQKVSGDPDNPLFTSNTITIIKHEPKEGT